MVDKDPESGHSPAEEPRGRTRKRSYPKLWPRRANTPLSSFSEPSTSADMPPFSKTELGKRITRIRSQRPELTDIEVAAEAAEELRQTNPRPRRIK